MTNSHDLITPNLFHDLPLEPGWGDDKAFFRFEDYANTFARLIASTGTRTPLVLGMSGKWGSGKTTLLKLLRSKLDETQWLKDDLTKISFVNSLEEAKHFRRCRTVWFNAWKYADENSLLAALVRAILAEMARGGFNDKLKSLLLDKASPRRDVLATFLSMFKFKLGEAGFEPDIDSHKTETPFATHTAFFDHFSEAFDQLLAAWVHDTLNYKEIEPEKGALVILIDDLDRCLPPKTMQVLEAVKLFLDKPGAVFVIGADEDVIRSAVEAHYHNQKITGLGAEHYLEKIFQLRFALPPLAEAQVGDYMTGIGLHDDLSHSLNLIFAAAETNPRQIKTFVNYLEVSWAILQNSGQAAGVNREDFTRWLTLTRVAPEFCDRVRSLEDKDLRLKFIGDAVSWARGLGMPDFAEQNTTLVGTFREYEINLRLRRVLKQIAFSPKVTAEVLEALIFWSAPPPEVSPESAELKKVTLEIERLESEVVHALRGAAEVARSRLAHHGYLVKIPAGKFLMGSKPENKLASDDEQPQHTVEIPYDYLISRTPITNAQFRLFVEATSRDLTSLKDLLSDIYNNHPVVQVSWDDAQAYCVWLTEKMRQSEDLAENQVVRLPTEAEWEKAARGEYGNEWPWGNEWDKGKCNSSESNIGKTTSVGQYSPAGDSPYGVADMAGNVLEWCGSLYKPYPYRGDDGREDLKAGGARVVRGGSYFNDRLICRAALRYRPVPADFDDYVGFRVVVGPLVVTEGQQRIASQNG